MWQQSHLLTSSSKSVRILTSVDVIPYLGLFLGHLHVTFRRILSGSQSQRWHRRLCSLQPPFAVPFPSGTWVCWCPQHSLLESMPCSFFFFFLTFQNYCQVVLKHFFTALHWWNLTNKWNAPLQWQLCCFECSNSLSGSMLNFFEAARNTAVRHA